MLYWKIQCSYHNALVMYFLLARLRFKRDLRFTKPFTKRNRKESERKIMRATPSPAPGSSSPICSTFQKLPDNGMDRSRFGIQMWCDGVCTCVFLFGFLLLSWLLREWIIPARVLPPPMNNQWEIYEESDCSRWKLGLVSARFHCPTSSRFRSFKRPRPWSNSNLRIKSNKSRLLTLITIIIST